MCPDTASDPKRTGNQSRITINFSKIISIFLAYVHFAYYLCSRNQPSNIHIMKLKFPQIVADALAKADFQLAGEVYQALMAYAFRGTEPQNLTPAADAIFTLAKQFIAKAGETSPRRVRKKPEPKPEPVATHSSESASGDTPAHVIDQSPAPLPYPTIDDPMAVPAVRTTTVAAYPPPANKPPKSAEARRKYEQRVRDGARPHVKIRRRAGKIAFALTSS